LVLRDHTDRAASQDGDRLQLRTSEDVNVELSFADADSSDITAAALSDLPESPRSTALGERQFGVATLLAKLRYDAPPPSPPSVMVTRRSTFTDVDLEVDGLVE
jgi:hypothetical protein